MNGNPCHASDVQDHPVGAPDPLVPHSKEDNENGFDERVFRLHHDQERRPRCTDHLLRFGGRPKD
jgi:hypothetical protein